MPPTNSPNETRPSTPPPYTFATSGSSLSSHPYLQQLEEAISTPVPDLASTLTTPESRPRSARRRIHSRTGSGWDGRTVLHLSQEANELEDQLREDEAYLARSSETIHRIQSEVERWQHERNRLRDILHTQQDRQSLLEEQNYRLREHRTRLRQEHQRLHEQSSRLTEQNTRLRTDFSRLQDEQNNLDNLAGAIAEVGRDNYATSGSGPSRERLYDWAATRPQEDPDEDIVPAVPGEVDSRPRQELDRALRNYRMARNAFRSGRQPGSDVGAVPTASALRAYWNEEPPEPPQPTSSDSSASRTPFALSEFVEQHRQERQRRHLDNVRRHNEQRARIEGQYDHHRISRDMARCSSDGSEAFMRVRNTLRYLSDLRETNVQGGLELARELGLDSLYECPDANTPSDLPMTVESLPVPQPSSWLKPGMSWHGLQSTDREPTRPTLLASTLRRIRQRDYVGRAMARRGYTNDPYSQHSYRSLQPIPPEDADRYLTSLMQDTSNRWNLNEPDHHELPGSSTFDASPLIAPDRNLVGDADHWPVTVTLHSIDWDDMTIAGTMRASQIPDKSAETEGKSMESYFQGEIIDFCNHTLQSDGSRFVYKVGGVDIDARYWARLGPFKREIDRVTSSIGTVKKWDGKTKYVNWGASGPGTSNPGKENEESLSSEDRQRREAEAEEVMARCLGSTRWLREKLGGEWVLMRWKEKCFVDPILPSATKSHTTSSVQPTSSEYPSTSTTLLGDRAQAQWGLTISGFYYIALHRQTGRIDGLYYDPGSQPYQSLRMAPEGCKLMDENQEAIYSGVIGSAAKELDGTGLKKWFPAVEFR